MLCHAETKAEASRHHFIKCNLNAALLRVINLLSHSTQTKC